MNENGYLYIGSDSTSYLKQILFSNFEVKNLFNWENSKELYYSVEHC